MTGINLLPDLVSENKSPNKGMNLLEDMMPSDNESNTVNTMLGEMPKEIPQLKIGTPENKDLITEMMSVGAGAPSMNMVGNAVKSFGQGIKSVLTKVNPKELARGAQKKHDTLMTQAGDIYNLVKDQAKKRGVNNIEIPEDILMDAAMSLPKTRANATLIANAAKGDYEALHTLQSDLGKKGTAALTAPFGADRNIGEEILDTRAKINEAIRDKFHEYGHSDLAKLLDQAKDKWKYLKETYYSHPTVARMVEKGSRKVPKNPFTVFSEESEPMQKFLSAHPEISKGMETTNIADNFMKNISGIKNIGTNAGKIGLGLYGVSKLKDIISTLNENQNQGEG